jgi:AraC family transcriptional regulator
MYKVISNHNQEPELTAGPCNVVVFSMLKEFASSFQARSFSIRYVVEGVEHYKINGHGYSVGKGQYLLANNYAEGNVEIDGKQTATGVCIGLMANLVSEALASYCRPDTPVPDIELDKFFNTPNFLESQYNAAETRVGALLRHVSSRLNANPFQTHQFTDEFYFHIAEEIVQDYIPVYRQLQRVPSLKQATKTDLLRRLQRGKMYMENHFLVSPGILSIAREAGISEFHFFRLFKAVYGATPYQYLLELRLRHARQLLESGKTTVSGAAYESGFADVYCLSRAFKKYYGIPPSQLASK